MKIQSAFTLALKQASFFFEYLPIRSFRFARSTNQRARFLNLHLNWFNPQQESGQGLSCRHFKLEALHHRGRSKLYPHHKIRCPQKPAGIVATLVRETLVFLIEIDAFASEAGWILIRRKTLYKHFCKAERCHVYYGDRTENLHML